MPGGSRPGPSPGPPYVQRSGTDRSVHHNHVGCSNVLWSVVLGIFCSSPLRRVLIRSSPKSRHHLAHALSRRSDSRSPTFHYEVNHEDCICPPPRYPVLRVRPGQAQHPEIIRSRHGFLRWTVRRCEWRCYPLTSNIVSLRSFYSQSRVFP